MNSSPSSESFSPFRYWVLVGLAALFRFAHLGFPDLQAWDEALYAVRARGILLFGGWLDQTSHSIGGLYSSLHPPLHVWLTALAFEFLGTNELTARLVSAIAGALTVVLVYLLGKRWMNAAVGLYAALFFGLNQFSTFYTRQGQFDSLLVLFLTLSVFFLTEAHKTSRTHWSLLAGVAIGCALMTKLYVGLGIPLVYLVWLLFSKERSSGSRKSLLVSTGVAVLLALPWHVLMTLEHGAGDIFFFLKQSALIERATTGVEGNVKPLEVFYFVNQVFVVFPFGAALFLSGLREAGKSEERVGFLLFLWFTLFFLVFSIMRTKLAVYMMPSIVPASLLAGRELWNLVRGALSSRHGAILVGLTCSFVAWSSSQAIRNSVKAAAASVVALTIPPAGDLLNVALLAVVLLFLSGCTLLLATKGRFERIRQLTPALLFVPLAFSAGWHVFMLDRFQYVDGATMLKEFVHRHEIRRIVVAGYDRNPQITWYFDGADIGWRDDITIRRINPPSDSTQYTGWLEREMEGEFSATLLVIEKDKFVRYKTVDPRHFVPFGFQAVFDSRRYSGFVRTRADQLAADEKGQDAVPGYPVYSRVSSLYLP